MVSHIENIVNAYKSLTKIPSILGGRLNKAGNRVTAKWSIRNLDKGSSSKYNTNYILDDHFNVFSMSDFGTDVSNELLSSISPQETFKAIVREDKNGKDGKKQFLEVWSKNTLAHSIDLTALDLHGDVYADSEFGCLEWSHDETAVVYVAERKQPKYEPYIKRKGEKQNKASGEPPKDGGEETKKGEEFIYREDWGEQLVGKYSSVIVVCHINDESFTVLDHLPKGCCPGQVRFTSSDKKIVGVAWETEPRRLGLIFCTNRPGFIFIMDMEGNFDKISKPGKSVRSPRVLPNDSILWLQRDTDGPHHACHQLVILKNNSDGPQTVIDIVENSVETTNKRTFHGIYSQALTQQCSARDNSALVFSTPQHDVVKPYVVHIDSGELVDISIPNSAGSTSVLDVKNDVILAAHSNMATPAQLYVARLPPKGRESDMKWVRISEPITVPATLTTSVIEHLNLEHKDCSDDVKSFSAIYFAPKTDTDKKLPLIVWPHGGPHSTFVNAYSLEAALFNMLGFASLQINYRGSTGAGDKSVHFLLSRVGKADVVDCKLATDVAVTKFPIDRTKLVLFGGSHGGFLVTHLSGQYPDLYFAVVSRNPVIDVATMFNLTDINDWCAVEVGFPFTEAGPVSEEELLSMRRCSPLAHVHKVKAPTALMLGSGDKRVPKYQGLEYARRLKANGVETRVYMYDDNHSLSSQPAEMDNLINSAHWFLSHIDPQNDQEKTA